MASDGPTSYKVFDQVIVCGFFRPRNDDLRNYSAELVMFPFFVAGVTFEL